MTTGHEQKPSIAYKAGLKARQEGIKLEESAIGNLLPGCQQYNDFIAGYDSLDNMKSAQQKNSKA